MRSGGGFTLMEILVVVVIIGMIAGVAMPGFSRAMKGAELRSSARTLAMAHKYARNTAVLKQVPMALLVDTVGMEIEVVSQPGRRALRNRDGFLDARRERANAPEAEVPGGEPAATPASAATIASELRRPLGRNVKVDSFETVGSRKPDEIEGIYWVNYHPNGMCDGFKIRLVDANGRWALITAEGISGVAEVEWEP